MVREIFSTYSGYDYINAGVTANGNVLLYMPMPKGANVTDWNAVGWKIYVGFQPAPEEFEFSRRQAAAVKKN